MVRPDVLVVGGGVVGLFISYFLRQNKHNVVLLAGGDVTKAASWGNAGYISPGFGSPISSAEKLRQLIKLTFSKDSPIKVTAKFLLREILPGGWLPSFLRKSSQASSPEFAKVIRTMALESLELFEQVVLREGLEVEFKKPGLFEVYINEAKLMERIKHLEEAKKLLVKFRVLSSSECREEEPLVSKEVKGGIIFDEDAWANPSKVVLEMRRILKKKDVQTLESHAKSFERVGRIIKSVTIEGKVLTAETFVIACGAWTPSLLSGLGVSAPIAAARGYAIKTRPTAKRLKRPVLCGDYRIATSQLEDGRLRASGFFELAYPDDGARHDRFDFLMNQVSKFLVPFKEVGLEEKWLGSRPCSPDGLPLVGHLAGYDNLLLATGHCRLGLTLSAITGKLIVDILEGKANKITDILSPSRLGL